VTDALVPEKNIKGRFVTGNIGGGRHKGSRNKLGEAFMLAMHESFEAHGPATIETVRTEKPEQYLKVIASLLPKEFTLNVNDAADMTDDELAERIRSLGQAIAPFLVSGVGGANETASGTAIPAKPAIVH
jgi:hypothetical protein